MAGIFYSTMPVLTVVLAPLFLAEETFTRRRLLGALVGLAGVILVIGPSALANAGDQYWAAIISFLAPVNHARGAIFARRQPHIAPPAMATGRMVFGAAFLTPLAFLAEEPLSLTPSLGAIGAMLVTGIASSIILPARRKGGPYANTGAIHVIAGVDRLDPQHAINFGLSGGGA